MTIYYKNKQNNLNKTFLYWKKNHLFHARKVFHRNFIVFSKFCT